MAPEKRGDCLSTSTPVRRPNSYCSTNSIKKGRLYCAFLASKVTCLLSAANPRCEPKNVNRRNVRGFARMIPVRHRSHATYSRQPRQVRKEATVTGSCVCSGSPVPGLFCFLSQGLPGVSFSNRVRALSCFEDMVAHSAVDHTLYHINLVEVVRESQFDGARLIES